MPALQVAISQDLLSAFAAIPRAQQRKVSAFISKFRNNPMASGINYERIHGAANPQYRSVRIDQDYRGIVLKPDTGNVYVFLWVAKHDEAYDWASRHKSAINPETGSLQIYEVLTEAPAQDEEAPDSGAPAETPAANQAAPQPLFDLRERELRRLGIPQDRLALVLALRNERELEAVQKKLPVEAFEALSFLAAGLSLDEVMQEYALPDDKPVDPQDMAAALRQPQSQRRFQVVEDDMQLQQMLQAPLEQWRVFLHPTQRQLVEHDWNGPVRVLGGAGTGKTVVAMHRARWLVRRVLQPGERLLLTTYTRNLAADIEANLRSICTPDEMAVIEVTNLDAWVSRFMKRERQDVRMVWPGQPAFDRCWDLAMTQADAKLDLPESFYREEWQRVILPNRIRNRKEYFAVSRTGRGTPLSRRQRANIWPVFEEARLQLHQAGLVTAEDAMFAAKDLLASGAVTRRYRCVVVDEAQDFGPEAMQLLRALVAEAPNDIMIVGDAHQRIYGRKASLGSCGINIRGRGRKLRINYRTTEQIRSLATAVLQDVQVDDLDEGHDPVRGYRSLRQGTPPVLQGFDNAEAEAQWVTEEIGRLGQAGIRSQDICIVGRTKTCLKRVQRLLNDSAAGSRLIDRNQADDRSQPGVRLANMHRVKGLEFQVVFIINAREGRLPLPAALRTDDPAEKQSKDLGERALFHVAATRAISQLYVTWSEQPSPYIASIKTGEHAAASEA